MKEKLNYWVKQCNWEFGNVLKHIWTKIENDVGNSQIVFPLTSPMEEQRYVTSASIRLEKNLPTPETTMERNRVRYFVLSENRVCIYSSSFCCTIEVNELIPSVSSRLSFGYRSSMDFSSSSRSESNNEKEISIWRTTRIPRRCRHPWTGSEYFHLMQRRDISWSKDSPLPLPRDAIRWSLFALRLNWGIGREQNRVRDIQIPKTFVTTGWVGILLQFELNWRIEDIEGSMRRFMVRIE